MATLGCQKEKDPIKLGFVGCLTGRLSDLGTSGRNGALLAVEGCYGAQGEFRLDPNGDPRRKRHLIRVKDGKFRSEKSAEMNGKELKTS